MVHGPECKCCCGSLRELLADKQIETPAFVCDEGRIVQLAKALAEAGDSAGCKVLSTLKPLTVPAIMKLMAPYVDGFAASSLFEAMIAREVLGDEGTVHVTTPGFRAEEIDKLAETCDYIAFNSLSQWSRFADGAAKAKCGLRINPQLAFVEDDRYNPCRKHSKLGVPMDQLIAAAGIDGNVLKGLTGFHFHTNCDCGNLQPLLATAKRIESRLGGVLKSLEWVNLGGGYLYNQAADLGPLRQAVRLLHDRFGAEVFIEPGAALVRDAGYIVSRVIDMFDSGGKKIAVLDTTVNHMPEVFEYQFSPRLAEPPAGENYTYLLAGCSCLAGDLFGEYGFEGPLEIGSMIVIADAGAYAMVKWHWFNGINIPTLYSLTEDGAVVLRKRFGYEDFLTGCGGRANVTA